MYVFMKLQQHGGAVLSSSGEWEALEGGEEEQQALRPKSHIPQACPWAWGRGGGARGPPPRAGGSGAPGSGDQHSTGFPGWEPRRAPWSHNCGVPTSLPVRRAARVGARSPRWGGLCPLHPPEASRTGQSPGLGRGGPPLPGSAEHLTGNGAGFITALLN